MVASYTVPALNVGFSANKCMISVFNNTGSGKVVRVYRAWALNNQIVAVTGVLTNLELRKTSASSGGTVIAPTKHDSASANIVAAASVPTQTITAGSWATNTLTLTFGAGSSNTVITGTTWAAGLATITTGSAHGYVTGQNVTIASVNPAGFNGTFQIFSVPSTTTFTYALASTPGAWVSGGTTNAGHGYLVGNGITVSGVTPTGYNGTYTITAVPSSTTVSMTDNTDPTAYSSGGTVVPAVTCGTNQSVTLTNLYRRVLWSTDEPSNASGTTAVTIDELEILLPFGNIWSMGYADAATEPITLREGEGLAVINTGAAVGQADFFFEMTVT